MKNYEEITNELLERRDCYIAEQKRKRKTAMGVITSCCCVCLVALLSFGMWQRGMFRTTPAAVPDDPADTEYAGQVAGNISSTTGKTPGNQVTDHAPNQHLFTINKVQSQVGAAMLDYALKEGVYGEVKTLAEITDYLGRDYSALKDYMPEGFSFVGNYEAKFYYEDGGKIVHDPCAFGYQKDDQEITILVSKIGAPYDCLFLLDNPIASEINGVAVTMGGIYKDEASGEFDLVFADFSHNGLHYRVTVENVPSDGEKDAPIWLIGIVMELID